MSKKKKLIINAVIKDLKKSFAVGDYTVLEELLGFIPRQNLIEALPESKWHKYQKKITELCPQCDKEVKLKNKFEVQNCPSCKKQILPCSICDHGAEPHQNHCDNCPLEKQL